MGIEKMILMLADGRGCVDERRGRKDNRGRRWPIHTHGSVAPIRGWGVEDFDVLALKGLVVGRLNLRRQAGSPLVAPAGPGVELARSRMGLAKYKGISIMQIHGATKGGRTYPAAPPPVTRRAVGRPAPDWADRFSGLPIYHAVRLDTAVCP